MTTKTATTPAANESGDFLTFLKHLYLGAPVEEAARAAGAMPVAQPDVLPLKFKGRDKLSRAIRQLGAAERRIDPNIAQGYTVAAAISYASDCVSDSLNDVAFEVVERSAELGEAAYEQLAAIQAALLNFTRIVTATKEN